MTNKELDKLLKDDKTLDEYLEKIENDEDLISINENASLLVNVLKEAEKLELKEMQKAATTRKERNKFVRGFTKTIKIAFAASFAFAITLGISKMDRAEFTMNNEANEKIDEIYENYSNFMLTQIDFDRLVDRSNQNKN